MTSGTRVAVASHCGQWKVMSSTNGRCGSIVLTSRPVRSDSSAREATAVRWSWSQRQIGSGVPQYRERDNAQSMLLRSQSP